MKRLRSCLILAGVACGGGGGPAAPVEPVAPVRVLATVAIALSTPTLQAGQTATVRAAGLDQFGDSIRAGDATWTSSAPAVATVSASGVVQALSPGQTTLAASIGGRQGFASLTVTEIRVAAVSIVPETVALLRGNSRQLVATLTDYAGRPLSGRPVDWSSSDGSKAAVSSSGVVTAVGQGEVTITARSDGVSASALVTVAGTPGSVATIAVTPSTAAVVTGDTLRFAATLRDVEGNVLTGQPVRWTVSAANGAEIATISDDGVLIALSAGSVVVEATSDGQRGAANIAVRERVDEAIVLSVAAPRVNETVDDTLKVIVAVHSPDSIVSVVATLGAMRSPLVYGPISPRGALGWSGTFDLSLVRYGPYTVVVIATDKSGNRGLVTIAFKRGTVEGEGGGKSPPRNK